MRRSQKVALFLIEVPDEDGLSDTNFIHFHQLDGEDVEVRRLPQRTLKEYDQQQELDVLHGAN